MYMKTEEQIEKAADRVETDGPSKFKAMTYEQGVKEALEWVLGFVEDDEFEFAETP